MSTYAVTHSVEINWKYWLFVSRCCCYFERKSIESMKESKVTQNDSVAKKISSSYFVMTKRLPSKLQLNCIENGEFGWGLPKKLAPDVIFHSNAIFKSSTKHLNNLFSRQIAKKTEISSEIRLFCWKSWFMIIKSIEMY